MENKVHRGRGAASNATGRFESSVRGPEEPKEIWEEEGISPRTVFYRDASRSILTRNESPDIPFSVSLNPYRGCEHGCIYCYARPTHEYLGLSAGIDFETKIFVKEEAPILLRQELMKKSYVPEVVNISGITDCYQPAERKYRLTRACLEVLAEFQNPFTIITKNQLVTRDIDLIAPMAEIRGAGVFVTVTSLDAELAAKLEPRTSRPHARLEAIRALSEAGVPTGVMVAPVIPGLTDHELPKILEATAGAGAKMAGFTPVRLPYSVKDLFAEWLALHFPERKEKVLARIREIRDGKLNESSFGSRMRGSGPVADILGQLFHQGARKYGLDQFRLQLTTEHFRRPGEQLALF